MFGHRHTRTHVFCYRRLNLPVLGLGALGIANMWFAIFADVGVMVIAVLNAIRALRVQNL